MPMFDKLVAFLRKSDQPDEVARVAVAKSVESAVDAALNDESLSPDEQVAKAESIIKSYEDETGDTDSFGEAWIAAQIGKDGEVEENGEVPDEDGAALDAMLVAVGDGESDEGGDTPVVEGEEPVSKCGCGKADCKDCKGKKGEGRTSTKKEDEMDAQIRKEYDEKIVTLTKSLEDQATIVKSMQEEKAQNEARATVTKIVGLIPADIDAIASAFRKMDEKEQAAFTNAMSAANEQAKIAGLTVEKGVVGTSQGNDLDAAVAVIRKADPTLTEAQATDKALTANPKLYTTAK